MDAELHHGCLGRLAGDYVFNSVPSKTKIDDSAQWQPTCRGHHINNLLHANGLVVFVQVWCLLYAHGRAVSVRVRGFLCCNSVPQLVMNTWLGLPVVVGIIFQVEWQSLCPS